MVAEGGDLSVEGGEVLRGAGFGWVLGNGGQYKRSVLKGKDGT